MLLAVTAPGFPARLARWLQKFHPLNVYVAPGIAPSVLRAHFDPLPGPWQALLSAVIVHYVELTPEGSASIFVEDSPEKVRRFIDSFASDPLTIRDRQTQSSVERVTLTTRQLEVLSLAVALGYYETPHKLNLRELAKKLGLSVGAVSELLRRGESLIITNYIDSMSASDLGDAKG
jgi:hypothetical protein